MRVSVSSPRGASAAVPSLATMALANGLAIGLVLFLGLGVAGARADDAPAAPAAPAAAAAAPKDTARAEVATPLQAAQNLIKDKKYKEALAKVHEAELIPNRNAYESFMIERIRAAAATLDGNDDVALPSYEALVAGGRLSPPEQARFTQAIASTYFKLKNYPKASSWAARYFKDGGTDASVGDIQINALYLMNDYAGAAAELKNVIDADDKAGRKPTEVHLQILLNCYIKTNNSAGSGTVLEKLLLSYPKKDYWDMAIGHLQHRVTADRLALDVLRLRFMLGDLRREGDYMTLAQLDLEAGFPSEAKKAVDAGYAAGILGKGAEAERHQRLRNKVNKDAIEDLAALSQGDADAEKLKGGDGLINSGFNYVLNGKSEKGLALMEQGLHKGGLKHAEDSKLHLGIAYYIAGNKAKAVEIFHGVQGSDGTSDLAHLWAVNASR